MAGAAHIPDEAATGARSGAFAWVADNAATSSLPVEQVR